jgi:2-beta-glucuronyltransferase
MGTSDSPTIAIVSAVHDYRMTRRGSIQAVADAFKRSGYRVVFLSVRFSALSLIKHDPRSFLRQRANRFEDCSGIECYLWRTPLHPFATRTSAGNALMGPLHNAYEVWPNKDVDAVFRQADVILVESGMGVLLIHRARRLNPEALIVYRAADALDTIGAHPFLQRRLVENAADVDHYCLLSRNMAHQFGFARERAYVVAQAIHRPDFEKIGPSPFGEGRHAVSVGSMLFDSSFFEVVSEAFPDVTFHVIGCGKSYSGGGNVRVYEEMTFAEMLPFAAHADVGIAPYREAPASCYLADSSLKLTHFAFLRRPAVCPHFAVGEHRHRFGYTPGDREQIIAAMGRALDDRFEVSASASLSWDEVVPRLLRPQEFPDTTIAPSYFQEEARAANVVRAAPINASAA